MSAFGLFLGFARVGLLGFGGGQAMIPLMQAECVGRGWISDEEFLEGLAVANTLPGPISTKMALFVGWTDAGLPGAVAAVAGVLTPSLALMGVLVVFLSRFREHPSVAGALRAAKPAVVGMLAWVVWDLAPTGITGAAGALLAGLAFVALLAKVHPGFVMIGAMAFGAVALRG